MMRQLATHPPLVEQVYAAILDEICEGRLEPGARLTQESVASQLDVSRQPVGQALLLLKAQGFVCDAGRRGLMVAPLRPDFVRALYEVRSGLDVLAAGLAARRRGADARVRGQQIVAAGRAAAAGGDVSALIAADLDFHVFVYEIAGNPLIEETMALYWGHMRRVMSAILVEPGNAGEIWREHGAILDAIVAGDAAGAEQLARAHVSQASEWLQQGLREDIDVPRRRKQTR